MYKPAYMVHTNSVLVAIDPRRPNPTVLQKTISVNDFYRAGIDPEFPFPMGNLQPVGKLQGAMMRGAAPYAPEWSLRAAAFNPALTIAAQALRVGDYLRERLGVTVSQERVSGAGVP